MTVLIVFSLKGYCVRPAQRSSYGDTELGTWSWVWRI